jgi:hypothetical protein
MEIPQYLMHIALLQLLLNSCTLVFARRREVVLHRIDRRAEEVLATPMNDPAVQIHVVLGRVFAVRQTDGARRVVGEPLSNNGIDTGAALTDELVLAAREVVVAGPACSMMSVVEHIGCGTKNRSYE